jgi:lipopolysaccharide/colanic/teichoic acid biosynthesis glycosyltransferase
MRVETHIPPIQATPVVNGAREVEAASHGFYLSIGKRFLDVVCSAFGVVIFSPLLLLIAALVKITSRGPILFSQERVGRAGIPFRLIKFRSMTADSSSHGPSITTSSDSRITRFGRFLRKTKLDEMPQLWNVLRGEMSLVGPRPEVPEFVHGCVDYLPLLQVRPGITDPASIAYRHEEWILATQLDPERFYREQLLPQKLALSSEYVKNISFRRDLSILILTCVSVFQTSPR